MTRLKAFIGAFALALGHALAYTALSNTTLESLPSAPLSDFDIHNKDGLLAPILIPRVPGTDGSALVRLHFANFFSQHLPNWKLGYQNSTSTTPTSNGRQVPFVNVIATRDPPWIEREGDVGRLVLVAHYDSLSEPTGFVGAIDSAAPCAMLLHTARSIDEALTKKWEAAQAQGAASDLEEHKGVQILFLDGEEAFKYWSSTDSTYGARALAEEWEATPYPAMSTYRNPLNSMDLFVLLDLLGAADPEVPSYFKTTHWAYRNMAAVESRLRDNGRMRSKPKRPFLTESDKTDRSTWLGGVIEDDHIPFITRGVEILHIIPSNFPPVWHTMEDDGEHLDIDTVIDWAVLTSAFTAEWMELDGFFSQQQQESTSPSLKRQAVGHDNSEL